MLTNTFVSFDFIAVTECVKNCLFLTVVIQKSHPSYKLFLVNVTFFDANIRLNLLQRDEETSEVSLVGDPGMEHVKKLFNPGLNT